MLKLGWKGGETNYSIFQYLRIQNGTQRLELEFFASIVHAKLTALISLCKTLRTVYSSMLNKSEGEVE